MIDLNAADERALKEASASATPKEVGDSGGSVTEDGDDVDESSDDGEGDGMPDLDDGDGDGDGDVDDQEAESNVPQKRPAKQLATNSTDRGGGSGGSGRTTAAEAASSMISDVAVPTCLECGSPARTCLSAV